MTPYIVQYSYGRVAVSIAISILAAYSAFSLAERLRSARGRQSHYGWLLAGSAAMGTGIWAMHYLGMLAVKLPIDVRYYMPTVIVSLLLAIAAAAVALTVVSSPSITMVRVIVGGVLMGGGIGGMHYVGMGAMRMQAMHHYRPGIVALSIAVAVVLSSLALWMSFALGQERFAGRARLLGAVVMGLAIASMHYTAMAGVLYTPDNMPVSPQATVQISSLGVVSIAIVASMVLALALIGAASDRRRYTSLARAQRELLVVQDELLRQRAELIESQQQLRESNALLNELSIRDSLTGVHNRRHFDAVLAIEWRRAVRRAEPVSVILLDVDAFKLINDNQGHAHGDEVLRQLAATLEAVPKRTHDVVARYGGEEFAVIMPGADIKIARRIAESLRKCVEELAIPHQHSKVARVVTVSAGVACRIPALGHSVDELLAEADMLLYMAKQKGRNRVETGGPCVPSGQSSDVSRHTQVNA